MDQAIPILLMTLTVSTVAENEQMSAATTSKSSILGRFLIFSRSVIAAKLSQIYFLLTNSGV